MSAHTAVVTGATQGLGFALAETLASRGWNLVIVARTKEHVEEVARSLSTRSEVIGVAADISTPQGRAALAEAVARIGAVDLLVNNAGVLGPSPQPQLLDYPIDVLQQVFEVNVFSQLAIIQLLRARLSDQAVIVNVSSDAAVNAYAGWGGYGASKAALDQISAVLAEENPEWRVLAVDPGDMRTAMHQAAFPDEDISDRPEPSTVVPELLALIDGMRPSGRYRARGTA